MRIVRNGDLGFLALLRFLLPLFYAQPLFWLLRRQVRLDQEALADAWAASSDRAGYAEILLTWARIAGDRPAGFSAGALGLWERPSQLRRRIALLLDSSLEIEPHSPRRWRMFAWGIAGLLVVGLSLATFRPVVARVGPAVHADEPAGANGTSIVFQGRVVDPDGRPFAGARVYLPSFKDTMGRSPVEPRATSGPDGHFRFTVAKSHFDRAATEPWKYTPVVAFANGYGFGVSDADEPDAERDVTLRLVRDDLPIRGRLLDREGRPVAGGTGPRAARLHVNEERSGSLPGRGEGEDASYL